ncbi:hypothetical protein HHX47_DHR9000265 [Lentinula edodes]|nr:hypothetical protein HHX47_DHR9000265 [Lentinula edodes]
MSLSNLQIQTPPTTVVHVACGNVLNSGNQRDQDRLKAQKKAAANAKKPKESASSLAKRKEA